MFRFLLLILLFVIPLFSEVKLGVDRFFDEKIDEKMLTGKRVGLIANHTAINRKLKLTWDLLFEKKKSYQLTALFSPEHGLFGDNYASETIADMTLNGIPVFSLHGKTRRPSTEMLEKCDILIFDIQDIGSRSYTYVSTLFYCLEEAGKKKIPFIVLDRPNPLGGHLVDGPVVEAKWRSFVGCAELPYCHGMKIGELARFFNEEYHLNAKLEVISMSGWNRKMAFKDTGLHWVPTSPHIPDPETAFFYPTTGLIGELTSVSIGVGYTLPFKVIGAPWINAEAFASKLNEQKIPGVAFYPFHFRPFFDRFKNKACEGVLICILDRTHFKPFSCQYSILGVLKSMYPKQFQEGLTNLVNAKNKLSFFNKLNGTESIINLILQEQYFVWKLRELLLKENEKFLERRKKYLISAYADLALAG